MESRLSDRKLKPPPPDPFRHQDSAIARTTSRYLLPPRLNMIRLSPIRSTVVPNSRFTSFGLRHFALATRANQARIGPSGLQMTRPELLQGSAGDHLHEQT